MDGPRGRPIASGLDFTQIGAYLWAVTHRVPAVALGVGLLLGSLTLPLVARPGATPPVAPAMPCAQQTSPTTSPVAQHAWLNIPDCNTTIWVPGEAREKVKPELESNFRDILRSVARYHAEDNGINHVTCPSDDCPYVTLISCEDTSEQSWRDGADVVIEAFAHCSFHCTAGEIDGSDNSATRQYRLAFYVKGTHREVVLEKKTPRKDDDQSTNQPIRLQPNPARSATPEDHPRILVTSVAYAGPLQGVVVGDDGRPLKNVAVNVGTLGGTVAGAREQEMHTDSMGRLLIAVPAEADSISLAIALGGGATGPTVNIPVIKTPSAVPVAAEPTPAYTQPGDPIHRPADVVRVLAEQGGQAFDVPIAKTRSVDGHQVLSTFEVPAAIKPGPTTWWAIEPNGDAQEFQSHSYLVTRASIDSRSLRSSQETRFTYDLDFGHDARNRTVCAAVRTSGAVHLVKGPSSVRINGSGKAKVEGTVRADRVAPGAALPFAINVSVRNCAAAK
jgi:hypothetical protein